LRQVWTRVDSTPSELDELEDQAVLGYQFSSTAAGLKAELAFGEDPLWRLLGWYHQGIPGFDETGFVAVGAGIEFLMVAD
ncbi:MAG: hypothetical protein VX405_02460, partial [Myxococcota bacterium]|nr:hypothetical protein [Myxococcota bacterium]